MKNIIMVTLFALLLWQGCQTAENTTYKTIGTQILAVEAFKKAVAEAYVNGHVSDKDFQNVRALADKYDASVRVEQSAILAWKSNLSTTNSVYDAAKIVAATGNDLLTFIYKLLPPTKVAELQSSYLK